MRPALLHRLVYGMGLLPMLLFSTVPQAAAVEVTVQNDSFVSGGSAVVVGDFVAGEQAGVRLTSPCNGTIVAVQIGWLNAVGSPPPASIEQAIHIYNGNTFPTPGAELQMLDSPLLTPGNLNEFRFIDENNTIPLSVPVTAGQQFFVTLEFANANHIQQGDASVFRDTNGCQSGKNVIYAVSGLPQGWYNTCTSPIFITGDFVIRAVIDCPAATGACCLPSGSCVGSQTTTQCTQQGGTYQGNNTTCAGVNCPQPTGGCCINGVCSTQTASNCATQGGTFLGAGVTCNGNSCKGACCVPSSQTCVNFTQPNCAAANGVFQGIGTTCATTVCFGACCLPSGSCLGGQTAASCAAQGGLFNAGQACASVNCPQPTGRCCLNGQCLTRVSQEDCLSINGAWGGPNSTCTPANVCSANCTGDIAPSGGDGVVNVADLLTVINNWGPCAGCAADVSPPGGDGVVNVGDLLTIINHWGACP